MKPKKSLGQNFLKSTLALNKIVEAGEVSAEDIILEIGPGKGVLTEKLLSAISASHKEADGEKAGCVVSVEKDRELFQFLQKKFSEEIKNKKLILINADILKFNFKSYKPKANSYKLIANIPYNITGAILKKFLQGNLSTPLKARNQPKMMVLMIQNEVAKRIIARDGKESILSISVKAYGDPKIVMKVPARYFSPTPEVDSAIIAIKNISRKIFIKNKIDERQLWQIIHTGFAHKRKKLSSNLKKVVFQQVQQGESLLKSLGNKRAEELTLKDWIDLTKML